MTFEVPTIVNMTSKVSRIVTLRSSQICSSVYNSRIASNEVKIFLSSLIHLHSHVEHYVQAIPSIKGRHLTHQFSHCNLQGGPKVGIQYILVVYCILCYIYYYCILTLGGPGSVVGIATAYGLDGPGIKSRWGEIFRTCPDRP